MLELNKASGLWDPQAPGRKVFRAFMSRLMFGPYPLGASGRRVCLAFLGRLVAGPFPFEALGSGRLAMGVGLGPKVPTMPPFFYRGGKPSPFGKRISLTIISWGTIYY